MLLKICALYPLGKNRSSPGYLLNKLILITAMNRLRVLLILLVFLLSSNAQAQDWGWVCGLKRAAVALAWVMMIIMGSKWIIAESPNDRAEAKKGMIYIVTGLLVIASTENLITSLYCEAATRADYAINCNVNFGC
jgi:hypothetical protein